MNIIIPMAGRGSRVRPHSITTPKPLLPIAGVPIVERLVETLNHLTEEPIQNIGFVIGKDFGADIETFLLELASRYNAKGHIYYQESPKGIAHALLCGEEIITGKIIIALADTLFVAEGNINLEEEGVLFVQKVEDPSAFGVITLNEEGYISALVEKPKKFVSDDAIVGIYYFQNGDELKAKMQYLIANNIRTKGEYQLTDAIELLRKGGVKLATQSLIEWLDCGNKDNIIQTNSRVLEHQKEKFNKFEHVEIINSTIIQPCYIAPNVVIENSVVGPYVSIGEGSSIKNSVVKKSVIQTNTKVKNKVLKNSMLGSHVKFRGVPEVISLGDYSFTED